MYFIFNYFSDNIFLLDHTHRQYLTDSLYISPHPNSCSLCLCLSLSLQQRNKNPKSNKKISIRQNMRKQNTSILLKKQKQQPLDFVFYLPATPVHEAHPGLLCMSCVLFHSMWVHLCISSVVSERHCFLRVNTIFPKSSWCPTISFTPPD